MPGSAPPPPPLPSLSELPWANPEPGRLMGRGHMAGDLLEAWRWTLLDESLGRLRLSCHLPGHVRNPRGQLFGGFTPTYVDLVALFTARAGLERETGLATWYATSHMSLDYLEPVVGPTFVIDSTVQKQRGRLVLVHTRFEQDGELAVLASTTLRAQDRGRTLGDG